MAGRSRGQPDFRRRQKASRRSSPPVLLCGQRVCRRSHSRHCRYAGRIPSDSRRSAAHRSSTFCEAISCAKSPTCCRRKSICWFTHNMLSRGSTRARSEEHTSELQSHSDLVCRLLLEKKKDKYILGKKYDKITEPYVPDHLPLINNTRPLSHQFAAQLHNKTHYIN